MTAGVHAEIASLLARVEAAPEDLEVRRRAAEALDDAGRTEEALALLAPLVNFTAHDDESPLPCLCRACFGRAGARAGAADLRFSRAFAVAGDRVLHFWLLDELGDERKAVRRSVAEALKAKLRPTRTRQ
jgi:Flp pilus assembly protein TadD